MASAWVRVLMLCANHALLLLGVPILAIFENDTVLGSDGGV
jgi:hypothetical protein